MEKQELLDLLEKRELDRINNLSEEAFQKEAGDWFSELNAPAFYTRAEYMEDFMRWKEDYSVEELKELLDIK